MYKLISLFALLCSLQSFSQSIIMEFPEFAGKNYDFIIFQGSKVETVQQDTIPADGKFMLKIPEKYAPYTGMSRWLITGTAEGGGLDMAIPGYDFSVTCLSDKPNTENIVYKGFDAVNELNQMASEQQQIIDRFETMSKATKLYDSLHPLFAAFQSEKEVQIKAFESFHTKLKLNPSFNARFLPIVNVTLGITTVLTDDNDQKALAFNKFITNELNFNDLYVSGHWQGIIQSWVVMQMNEFNDKTKFTQDFKMLSNRINNPKVYTDFVDKMTIYLLKYGKDDYVDAVANDVINSGKITSYEGKTMQVYVRAMIGSQAPDLVITNPKDSTATPTMLKSKDFTHGKMKKTLLIFYQSGCGPCEALLAELPEQYKALKKKGIDIIGISADKDQETFVHTTQNLPWKQNYCDLNGINGVNFKNYAAIGTPMMFLIDKTGKIEQKINKLSELLN